MNIIPASQLGHGLKNKTFFFCFIKFSNHNM
jgi:hypothetical protein